MSDVAVACLLATLGHVMHVQGPWCVWSNALALFSDYGGRVETDERGNGGRFQITR